MKTLFIPLDERPCNLKYPQYMARTSQLQLSVPPMDMLSRKKVAADREALWEFIYANISTVDSVILSVDMLAYGGLIPSRIHSLDSEDIGTFVEKMRGLKAINPDVKVYAYPCIMRCPSYSSSDEEPNYYDQYGAEIFKRKYLQDKLSREGLSKEEQETYASLENSVPADILKDYESRREFNLTVNKEVVKLRSEGIIDFMVIPQDDSSPYGYTALDQKTVIEMIDELGLSFDIDIYPGADEVGVTLLARAYNDFSGQTPKVYPVYSSTLGPQIIPLYEDRPMHESVKAHIRAAGGEMCDTSEEADYILAINSPGKIMQEAAQQANRDITYSSFRHLQHFVSKIKAYLEVGKKVVIADSAYANGGELQLVKYLDQLNILGKIHSYKGWNTNCNTLGTTLGAGFLADGCTQERTTNIVYHIMEDVCYQSVVRSELIEQYFADAAYGHYNYSPEAELEAMRFAKQRILVEYQKLTANSLPQDIDFVASAPWQRTFEIDLDLMR